MTARRAWTWAAALLILLAVALLAVGYRNATADPVVRRLTLIVPDYPEKAPIRILLFSDVHVHGPDMPPSRVARIVDQINTLHPDIVIAAGDFIGNNLVGRHYPIAEAIAPLARLEASYGVYAVLGNNDEVRLDHTAASMTCLSTMGLPACSALCNEIAWHTPAEIRGHFVH